MKLTESHLTTVLAALLALTVLTASPALAAQTDNSNSNLNITVEEGEDDETVTVYLETSLPNVAGVDAKLEYNSDIVQFSEAEAVDLDDNALVSVNEDNEAGSLILSHGVPSSSAVDEPTMTALTFEVVGDGDMSFEIVGSETTVYEIVDGEPTGTNVQTMSVDMSTNDLSGDSSDETADESSGEDESSSDEGSASEGSSGDGGDGDAGTGDSSGEDQSNSEDSGDGQSDETSQDQPQQSTNAEEGSDSSLVSGVGMLAVVAGFLFAVAMLARDQM